VIAWEIVIMVRKLMIATIATVARDSYVQITCALALVVMALVLQARFSPYERSKHSTEDGGVEQGSDILNNIETISLLCLVYTQILSVLYLYIDSGDVSDPRLQSKWFEGLITAALVLLNATCVLSLSGLYLWAKLAPDHYKACDAEHFKCNKGQLKILFRRCDKAEKDRMKEELLPGWKVVLGRSSSFSYFNSETGETRWDRPTASSLKPLQEESEESEENESTGEEADGDIEDGDIEMTTSSLTSSATEKKSGPVKKVRALTWLSAKRAEQRESGTETSNPIRSWKKKTNRV
jgi:hypothetical protein